MINRLRISSSKTLNKYKKKNNKVYESFNVTCSYYSHVTGISNYSLELVFHSYNVAVISKNIAKLLNLPENEQNIVFELGNFHDIGKSMIPKEILFKPEKLTKEEFEIMKKHSEYSAKIYYDIMKNTNNKKDVQELAFAIQCHHENINGSGYPLGLKGTEIPFYTKILAIADRFEAVSHPRIYRRSIENSLKILNDMANNNKIDREIFNRAIPVLKKHVE